jgi:hypothetical protein
MLKIVPELGPAGHSHHGRDGHSRWMPSINYQKQRKKQSYSCYQF